VILSIKGLTSDRYLEEIRKRVGELDVDLLLDAGTIMQLIDDQPFSAFPPLYEAFFLELTLEVLREAGERLPTKVGQTMGIVGGIVIGQAAVSAGLTSNVMIIVVSLSALASFVTPSYVMGNAVRVIRFPIILLSGILGFIGLSVGLVTILIHLLNLSSLGAPYMSPWAPQHRGFAKQGCAAI
jgi:hypothetical protein